MTDDQPIPPAEQSKADADNDTADPNSNAVPEVKIPSSNPGYSITCQSKRDKWDIAKFVAEFVGLAFLILYTLYTAGIYCANQRAAQAAHDTLGEIQKQTTLMRQQMVGMEAAVVEIPEADPQLNGDSLGRAANVTVNFGNSGHIIARNVHVSLEISRWTLPQERALGKPIYQDWTIAAISPNKTPIAHVIRLNLPADQMVLLNEMQQTIKISGSFVYDNGFSDIVTQPICSKYLFYVARNKSGRETGRGGGFQSCEQFPAALDSALWDVADQKTR